MRSIGLFTQLTLWVVQLLGINVIDYSQRIAFLVPGFLLSGLNTDTVYKLAITFEAIGKQLAIAGCLIRTTRKEGSDRRVHLQQVNWI